MCASNGALSGNPEYFAQFAANWYGYREDAVK
jgi:hypothetical protein